VIPYGQDSWRGKEKPGRLSTPRLRIAVVD